MKTLSNPNQTKARKNHRCDFCCEQIAIGESYMNSSHVHDGEIYSWKTHKRCNDLANRMNMYDDCEDEGVSADTFMEYVSDKHNILLFKQIPDQDHVKYSDIINQLTKVAFRDKLFFVIRHYASLNKKA